MYDVNFTVVYERYEKLIYSLVHKYKLHYEKDEYVQIGRIALFKAWKRFDPGSGPFPSYAKRYIEGYLKDAIRKDVYYQDKCQLCEPVLLQSVCPPIDDESVEELKQVINTFGLSDRETIWVNESILAGYKPREIAVRHGVSTGTVHSWRKQALKKMRTIFFSSPPHF
ncbi:sigma-70 family RNA polymerase sigma factor [Alteribacter aurantiacus]|uniref:sigma-70 family RNA polymerase sigma factor n=1 Tax=Alteribacter aurantiacus TaxID=254410 RepID=UPI0004033371|nr:sigma-70 family RNA polymerase sigma factor [Alteribacter aurantiacus]